MKILIIRHCEPDYEIDGLTEKGKTEAELLKNRLVKEDITAAYCSVLGRARLTAKPTLEATGLSCEYCEWLKEFGVAPVKLPYLDHEKAPWDFLPSYLNDNSGLYSQNWRETDLIKNSNVAAAYEEVCNQFDKVLERHGYKREGSVYRVTRSNHHTLAFFCHFGLGSLLISHLMNCSPFIPLHHTFLPPSSVTTFISEERRGGVAYFRSHSIGDTAHLYAEGEPPSFSGRFCECFTDETRHD